eukprot:gnl/TRDRNA2_/TRDRNA2_164727_c0_seq3.p1 gnl/TRDRNA2_/TRDRNA2_164727_c0~~gnl/TRDRNA2_/TRDRNA2_164727_c0_seq3.p1  ORF type:complete len:471 (-),score=64.74 gnl/TRDRNA2_/TRDRNA2_164727_c0_seq3:38-1450(-)
MDEQLVIESALSPSISVPSLSGMSENQKALNKLNDFLLGAQSSYDKRIRPFPDCSAAECSHRVRIDLGIGFLKMLGINEKDNQLSMLAVMTLRWADYRLDFDAKTVMPKEMEWDSVTSFLPVDANQIWMPDVQNTNAAVRVKHMFKPRAYLYDHKKRISEGFNVEYQVPVTLTVKCKLDMHDFPFDKQECPFFFRSWSASTKFVWLSPLQNPPTLFMAPGYEKATALSDETEEFDITNITTKTHIVSKDRKGVHEQNFTEIVYLVELERFPNYYMSVIVLPLALMIVLSMGVFYIDPERGERLGVAMTLLLTVMAVSFVTAELLPKSGAGDTWMQRFQSGCYVFTFFPLFVTLSTELLRRVWLHRTKGDSDDDGAWITWSVDHAVRLPYSLCVVFFLLWVTTKYMTYTDESDVSVSLLLVFLWILAVLMMLLSLLEVVLTCAGMTEAISKRQEQELQQAFELEDPGMAEV